MKKAAVIGDPINHSLSPALFSMMSSFLGFTDFNYEAIQVKSAGLSEFCSTARDEFVGFNVTIPHKQKVITLLDQISPEAKAIGAVNVVNQSLGQAVGFNTDTIGITNSIRENGNPLQDRRVLILGAGGAARAAAYAVAGAGCSEVVVINKTQDRASSLVSDLSSLFPSTYFSTSDVQGVFSVIINATSVGMKGVESLPGAAEKFFSDALGKVGLAPDGVAFDLIYTPERTAFIKVAENFGFPVMGGLEMLIHQAIATWDIWFGQSDWAINSSKKNLLKSTLQKELRSLLREKPIFLSGFMGVGKSTVGRILAERMGWTFIDTDQWIEKAMGKTIPEIFAERGEYFFREQERLAISELVSKRRVIISLGGGVLTQAVNLDLIQRSGTLVYLSAPVEFLTERLTKSWQIRPMLHQGTSIEDLLNERLPTYRKADFEISTEHRTPVETAGAIEEKILDRTFK